MSRPIVKEHNLETNEIIEREMTDEEYADYLKFQEEEEAKAEEERAKATAKADLLAKLGITEEEAKLLLA